MRLLLMARVKHSNITIELKWIESLKRTGVKARQDGDIFTSNLKLHELRTFRGAIELFLGNEHSAFRAVNAALIELTETPLTFNAIRAPWLDAHRRRR